jgi:hypothetical protein
MIKAFSIRNLSIFIWLGFAVLIGKIYLDFVSAGGFCLGWAPGCLSVETINLVFISILALWTLLIIGINFLLKYFRSRKIKPSTK